MFLREITSGDLVEVLDLASLFDPFKTQVWGRQCGGEEPQDPTFFPKSGLVFPSGEALPRCWLDPHYRVVGPW